MRQLPEQDYEQAREYIMQRMEDTYAFDPPNRQPPEDAGKALSTLIKLRIEIKSAIRGIDNIFIHQLCRNLSEFTEIQLIRGVASGL